MVLLLKLLGKDFLWHKTPASLCFSGFWPLTVFSYLKRAAFTIVPSFGFHGYQGNYIFMIAPAADHQSLIRQVLLSGFVFQW